MFGKPKYTDKNNKLKKTCEREMGNILNWKRVKQEDRLCKNVRKYSKRKFGKQRYKNGQKTHK